MKVILLENINRVGKKHDIKEVANGYAMNFLFPQNLAIIYTENNYKIIEKRKKKSEVQKDSSDIEKLKDAKKITIKFKEKSTSTNRLFAQINKKRIVEKIFEEYNIKIKEDDLIINKPLKELGKYLLGVKPDLNNIIKIIIEKDEEN